MKYKKKNNGDKKPDSPVRGTQIQRNVYSPTPRRLRPENGSPSLKDEGALPLDQQRHQFAFSELKASLSSELNAEVKGLPIALRTQGLGVTVAMLLDRGTPASRRLARLLADWLQRKHGPLHLDESVEQPSPKSLLQAIVDETDPMRITAANHEAIAIAGAAKRIVGALSAGE